MFPAEQYLKFASPAVLKYLECVPYDIGRDTLYSVQDLFNGFDPENPEKLQECYDVRVYCDYLSHGKGDLKAGPLELWARACHDYFILNAMDRMRSEYEPMKTIGIMGGHAVLRTEQSYRVTVSTVKHLTEEGFLVVTGGGPGIMEAAHLGAWLAGRSDHDVEESLQILEKAPSFKSTDWYNTAYEVLQRFPQNSGKKSLAIPTWLYGHEPPTLFATHIAKLFSNSIREDKLIEISDGGLVFMPGSAGTLQEVFQCVEKNHYLTAGFPSPIVFVGKEHWNQKVPFYPVVKEMMKSKNLKNLISSLVDDVSDVLEIINDFKNLLPLILAKQEGKPLNRQELFDYHENIVYPGERPLNNV